MTATSARTSAVFFSLEAITGQRGDGRRGPGGPRLGNGDGGFFRTRGGCGGGSVVGRCRPARAGGGSGARRRAARGARGRRRGGARRLRAVARVRVRRR